MLSVSLIRTGCPASEALRLEQQPIPEPGPGEVRVRVLARPINPADLLLLEGRHLARPSLPSPIGIEGAGVIEALGEGVSELQVGDRVAIPYGGTWREQMLSPAAELIRLSQDLSLEQACMLAVNPFTAAGLLRGLVAGDRFVVNAAGSALGRMLLSLGRQRGLVGVALVRSPDHSRVLLELGAEEVLVDGPDLVERWRARGLPPVQRALDAVSGAASRRLFELVADGGELVVFGLLASDVVELPAAELVFRDVRVRGFSRLRGLWALPPAERQATALELIDLVRRGILASSVEARYPLEQVHAALEHQQRPGRRGKVLLCSDAEGSGWS